jgi:esterase/lipase superfamily enzyme
VIETVVDGGRVVRYGHWGRPVVAFPAERGTAYEFAEHGMLDAIGDLLEAGRVKLYCVDSNDGASWSDSSIPLEERARRHLSYEGWVINNVMPFVHHDMGGAGGETIALGVSMGAFHALNFGLKRADLFPVALGLSGNYDPSAWRGWGERGETFYFNNPMDYVSNLHGDHLGWLRDRLSVLLVCGQGQWEDTTGALESTRRMAGLLSDKGIRCELDVWGHDIPHDWPSWRRQLAHHLPRFC